MARADSREELQLRAIGCETGLLHRADGSAKYWQGNTAVLAAVYGPMEVPLRKEKSDRATIEVVFKPKVGLPGIAEKRLESLLLHVASHVIITSMHPRSSISIAIQTLCDDGAVHTFSHGSQLLACAINAMCLALLDAGVSLNTCVAAATCSVDNTNAVVNLDPTLEEEKAASSIITLAFLKDPPSRLALSHTTGSFTEEQYGEAWGLTAAATAKIIAFFRKSMERRLSKELHVRVQSAPS